MWALEYSDAAAKAFRKLDGKTQRAIAAKLAEVQALANPGDLAKPLMHELKGRWRVRVGGYRVIFLQENKRLVVLVVDIGRRDSVYE